MEAENKEIKEEADGAPVQTIDHLFIRDVETGKTLVNVRGTARNHTPEDSDGTQQKQ
jgi:hypothetical protein